MEHGRASPPLVGARTSMTCGHAPRLAGAYCSRRPVPRSRPPAQATEAALHSRAAALSASSIVTWRCEKSVDWPRTQLRDGWENETPSEACLRATHHQDEVTLLPRGHHVPLLGQPSVRLHCRLQSVRPQGSRLFSLRDLGDDLPIGSPDVVHIRSASSLLILARS